MHLRRRSAAGVLCLLLVACAPATRVKEERRPPPPTPAATAEHQMKSWRLDELAVADGDAIVLAGDGHPYARVALGPIRAYARAAARIGPLARLNGAAINPQFVLIEGLAPNAFAVVGSDRSLIAVNLGMLGMIGDDEAMWAAVLGHELAHLAEAHQQKRSERSEFGEAASSILSVALSFAGVPFAGLLTDGAAVVVGRSYSRDDERDADRLALDYMAAAGYELTGALRFHQRLAALSGQQSAGLLSTHPGGSERVEAIRQQIEARTAAR